MEIDKKHWVIWDNLTFKTTGYHKNFDVVNTDENIISEYCGTISLIRLGEYKPPLLVGEYEISVWNIGLAKTFNVNVEKLIKQHKAEIIYSELLRVVKEKHIDVSKFEKLILISNLILRPDHRKLGITEEFIEFVHREFYHQSSAIIALALPLQNNPIDADHYFNNKFVEIRNSIQSNYEIEFISALNYYGLKDLNNSDVELNEYKLFNVATKCGFNRIDESYLFLYSPEKNIERMLEKREVGRKINKVFNFK